MKGKIRFHLDEQVNPEMQKTRSIGKIIEGLALIYEVYSSEEMIGRVEYL